MGFYDEKGILANGAVLFADIYKGEKTAVQCSLFSGFDRGSRRIVTINRFQGNLLDSIDYMMTFVVQHMNVSVEKHDTSRSEIEAYPRRALFEGIINAVARRDYFLNGTQIQVDMFTDRLEISSPGSFYRGGKLGKTYDLSHIISKRRNVLISAVLVMCRVMEAAGTGFDKISEAYRTADQAHKPFILSSSDHFTLTLPDPTYQPGIQDDALPHLAYAPVPRGTRHDDQVLRYCFRHSRTAKEITEYLKVSDSSYFRTRVLDNLVKQGYLEASGGKPEYYSTSEQMVAQV